MARVDPAAGIFGDINLKGVWLCLKHEIAQMRTQGGGTIVNTSSAAGLCGVATCGAYAASKHGVVGLIKTAAIEYGKDGTRVNAVCPGPIQTPRLDRLNSISGLVFVDFNNDGQVNFGERPKADGTIEPSQTVAIVAARAGV